MSIPHAKRIAHPHLLHGDIRQDDYYWLNNREDPEVIEYLEEENRYFQETMRPLQSLTDSLYEEMRALIPEDDDEVAAVDGPYYYYRRIPEGCQYPLYARRQASRREDLAEAAEEVLLDLNREASADQFYHVTVVRMSPDQSLLGYLENRDGTDRYTLRIKNVASRQYLPDTIPNIFLSSSLEWDASGAYVFYVSVDASQRPYRLMRHYLGDSLSEDVCLYEERDVTFSLELGKTRDGRFIVLNSRNKNTNEVRLLPAAGPTQPLTLFAARRTGILYEVEHWRHDFVVLTNDQAENFRVMACPDTHLHMESCRELFPYDPARYLQEISPFSGAIVISGREQGLTQIWIYRPETFTLEQLSWPETLYRVSLGPNRSYDTDEVLIDYESFLTPRTTYGLQLKTGARNLLKRQAVGEGYDSAGYRQRRLWAPAADGTAIPLSVVYREGALASGPAPVILYGYGSYGMSMDPHFDAAQVPLMNRGVVLVTVHVRGGSELGRHWYEQGKLRNKRNTFTDFIDAARYLIVEGITTPDLLAARGRSAGGLLMGAVLNMAPELFRVVVPGVPFVDVVTTMLDASIPLTTLEWDEWGNPAEPGDYAYMKSYSPYDNIAAQPYPHMMVFTGLNDPRVGYWEPAKFVAKLRDTKTDARTLVLKTAMGAGHSGSSGRYNRLHDFAEEYAFILDKLNVQ